MSVTVTVQSETPDEVLSALRDIIGENKPTAIDAISDDELLALTRKRFAKNGFEVRVAQAKANGSVTKEVASEEDAKPVEEPEAPPSKAAKKETFRKQLEEAAAAKKASNGAAKETPDDMKTRCLGVLQGWWLEGKKDQVNTLLKEYGEGETNFSKVAPEKFGPISEAIAALQ